MARLKTIALFNIYMCTICFDSLFCKTTYAACLFLSEVQTTVSCPASLSVLDMSILETFTKKPGIDFEKSIKYRF